VKMPGGIDRTELALRILAAAEMLVPKQTTAAYSCGDDAI
jgi:hypothetical protein